MKLNTSDRKKFRIRNRLKKNNPNNRMRLTVSRSSKNISAQIIDDKNNKTLISATSNLKSLKDSKKKKSELSDLIDIFFFSSSFKVSLSLNIFFTPLIVIPLSFKRKWTLFNNSIFCAFIANILSYRLIHWGFAPLNTYKLIFGIILVY